MGARAVGPRHRGALAEALGPDAALSKSTVSRVCATLKDQYAAWTARRAGRRGADVDHLAGGLEGTTDNRDRVHGAIAAYIDSVEDRRASLLFGGQGPVETLEAMRSVRKWAMAASSRRPPGGDLVVCPVPGLMEIIKPRRMRYGGTTEVPRRAA